MKDFLDLKRLWLDAVTEDDINIVQRFSYFLTFFGIITALLLVSFCIFVITYLFYLFVFPQVLNWSILAWLVFTIVFTLGIRIYQGAKGKTLKIEEEYYIKE